MAKIDNKFNGAEAIREIVKEFDLRLNTLEDELVDMELTGGDGEGQVFSFDSIDEIKAAIESLTGIRNMIASKYASIMAICSQPRILVN